MFMFRMFGLGNKPLADWQIVEPKLTGLVEITFSFHYCGEGRAVGWELAIPTKQQSIRHMCDESENIVGISNATGTMRWMLGFKPGEMIRRNDPNTWQGTAIMDGQEVRYEV